jgi:hypothetical protein
MRSNEGLRRELIEMRDEDKRVRDELAKDGSLFEGYHLQMEAVHKRNAARLAEIIEQHGWPTISLVGEDGEEAAWLIAQHDIGEPHFQRRALVLIREAIEKDEAPRWQIAYLEDRIRSLEGRPQLYGSQFDWDENGLMSPYTPIEDEENVDERRASVGLNPLVQVIAEHRALASQSNEPRPVDVVRRRKAMDEWARSVGWRD